MKTTKYIELEKLLKKYDQMHLVKYFEELNNEDKESLLLQIEKLDFELIKEIEKNKKNSSIDNILPINVLKVKDRIDKEDKYRKLGEKALKENKVAAVILAGGMGTRLGVNHSKGMLDIGITKTLYVFECLINSILNVVNKIDSWIDVFIMTSDNNDDEIKRFLEKHNYFNYRSDKIHFFKQKSNICVDFDKKVILEDKNKIATSPNGNGGWFDSLRNSGCMDIIKKENIEWINIVSIDNVLQKIVDPVFIGATLDSKVNLGAKVIKKNSANEKVGVVCKINNKPYVVEYYEMDEETANRKDKEGNYEFGYGVILNYLYNVKKLNSIDYSEMPIHIVEKKIEYLNDKGEKGIPNDVNGYKFETLATDLVLLMETCLPYEVIREEEFAPIKNKEGVDSVETARKLLVQNGVML